MAAEARTAAIGSDQPKEKGPIGVARPAASETRPPLSASADVGAPGEEVAVGEVGEAQDRVGERHADGAEADHRPEDQAVEEHLRAHDAVSGRRAPR